MFHLSERFILHGVCRGNTVLSEDFPGLWQSRRSLLCVSRANSEIAQVRAKAKQEQAAYQASVRKEQMKVDSLECTLEQKVSQKRVYKIIKKFEM